MDLPNAAYDSSFCLTLIPGSRASNRIQPELRAQAGCLSGPTGELTLDFVQDGAVGRTFSYRLTRGDLLSERLDLSGLQGEYRIEARLKEEGRLLRSRIMPFEVVQSGQVSTGMIDGAWISLVHWSDDEAQRFNPRLKTAEGPDWVSHIEGMHRLGINTVVVQNLFHNNAYVNQHRQTAETYPGQSFYPSRFAPARYPIPCDDPVEIVLQTADRLGMTVFVGIGMYAWFDLSRESLKWHLEVTREVFGRYGHHPSLYGWYIPEEMFGDLLDNPLFFYEGHERDITDFFAEYKGLIRNLTPTKPILFAINNADFNRKADHWRTILQNIDILTPFGFARNPDNNLDSMIELCHECQTRLWVDFELFRFPFPDGLRPKDFDVMLRELADYRQSETVLGYQYTGILESPDSRLQLGGEETVRAFNRYLEFYDQVRQSGYCVPVCCRANAAK